MPKPGKKATRSGIYRCTECGVRKTIQRSKRLPPCGCGRTEWRLVSSTTKAPRKKAAKKKGRKKDKGLLDLLFG